MDFLAHLASLVDWRGILVVALIMIPFEQILPLHDEQKALRRDWLNDAFYLVFNSIPIKLGFLAVLAAIMGLTRVWLPQEAVAWIGNLPLLVQVPAVIMLADIGFYFAHRTFHRVPALWRFHAVHHSIEEMDWLAAHRVHPVDQISTMSASLVPVYVLGFDATAIAIYAVIYHWHALFIHSNTRLGLGWFGRFIATPHFHHWHHANEQSAWDKNYGGQLTVIDALMGTLHMPDSRPEVYGCNDPVPRNYVGQLIYPVLRDAADGETGLPETGAPAAQRS